MRRNIIFYVLKQWIVLNARADWFIKLRISCAFYLRATPEKMASRFASVTSEEIIQINFCGVYYLTVLVLIIYMKKLLDSDWLRAVQFKCNTSAKSVTPVQKV